GTLLPVHFFAGTVDLAAIFNVMRAALAFGELPAHAAMQDVCSRLEAKDRVRQFDRTCRLAVERDDLEFHVRPPCLRAQLRPGTPSPVPVALSGRRNLPGLGASFGSFFLTASRSVIQPPLAPGTAPSTRMSPRSTSVCTTLRLSVVTRSTPKCPGI